MNIKLTTASLLILTSSSLGLAQTARPTPEQIEKLRDHYATLPVVSESRWSITYRETPKRTMLLSKFLTEDAEIAIEELKTEWPKWGADERSDFNLAASWADTNSLPAIMRFLIKHGDQAIWSDSALTIADSLGKDEAEPFLLTRLNKAPLGAGTNFAQALASVHAPHAIAAIQTRLNRLWTSPELLLFSGGDLNWVAFEATHCIEYLTELGVAPDTLRDKAEAMLKHPQPRNREISKRSLEKTFGGTTNKSTHIVQSRASLALNKWSF